MARSSQDPDRLIGIREAVTILGRGWQTIDRAVESGDLPCIQTGKKKIVRRFRCGDVIKLREKLVQPHEPIIIPADERGIALINAISALGPCRDCGKDDCDCSDEDLERE